MPSKSLYTHKVSKDPLNKAPDVHTLSKFDKDMNFQVAYQLQKSQAGWVCTCPARMMVCRHVRMLGIFELAELGQDDLHGARSGGGLYSVFLEYDGNMFNWVRGIRLDNDAPEPEAA